MTDIVEAIERFREILGDMLLEAFERDWHRQWLVERGVEIISEASRHLPMSRKPATRNFQQKVAGIGNVLRHDYESVSAPILWKLALHDLTVLGQVRREELKAEKER